MSQTVTVSPKAIEEIISRLDKLTKDIRVIKERLFASEPPYGSEEWWEKEIKESEEEFSKGKGVHFESVKDATKWLNS